MSCCEPNKSNPMIHAPGCNQCKQCPKLVKLLDEVGEMLGIDDPLPLEEFGKVLKQAIGSLQAEARLAKAFHDVAVKERDLERVQADGRAAEITAARNLLAIIHRDGGHHREEHGLTSYKVAEDVVVTMRAGLEEISGGGPEGLWCQHCTPIAKRALPEEGQPKMQCPQCGKWEDDFDGFGMLAHTKPAYPDGCGYCTHPSRDNGVCGICGDVEDSR